MIKGMTVELLEPIKVGTDDFGYPVYEEKAVSVENVLVSPATSTDIVDSLNLHGKKAVYTLAIPKGDSHLWEDRKIRFFGETWRSFGFVTQGIEANIPLNWNKKVNVERYG